MLLLGSRLFTSRTDAGAGPAGPARRGRSKQFLLDRTQEKSPPVVDQFFNACKERIEIIAFLAGFTALTLK